ncbi:MAG: Xaa-Pro peptidase family protein [bacterium]|nr:Xaa-Pro peptidase family protein [bacterium]
MFKGSSAKETNLRFCTPEPEIVFSLDEYWTRLRRTREAMETAGIDLLYLTAPESRYYISGFNSDWYQAQSPEDWHPLSGVAVKADTDRFITFERDVNEVLVRLTTVGHDARIRAGSDERPMHRFIVDHLRDEGWLKGTVGLELSNYRPSPAVSRMIEVALEEQGCKVVDATDLLRRIRSVKSPQELAYVRTAAKIGDIGIRAAINSMRPGMTELDVYAEMVHAMAKAGGEHSGKTPSVASGQKTLCTDAPTTRRKIMPGEIVNIDICGCYNRYHTNFARTFSMGQPHPEVARRVAASARAFDVLAEAIRPGVAVNEVTGSVKAYYQEAGIWEERWWVGGYEMGIAFQPDWVGPYVYDPDVDAEGREFVPGTVVNYESDFFLPQLAGLSLVIDTMAFSEASAELLHDVPPDLIVIE